MTYAAYVPAYDICRICATTKDMCRTRGRALHLLKITVVKLLLERARSLTHATSIAELQTNTHENVGQQSSLSMTPPSKHMQLPLMNLLIRTCLAYVPHMFQPSLPCPHSLAPQTLPHVTLGTNNRLSRQSLAGKCLIDLTRRQRKI